MQRRPACFRTSPDMFRLCDANSPMQALASYGIQALPPNVAKYVTDAANEYRQAPAAFYIM